MGVVVSDESHLFYLNDVKRPAIDRAVGSMIYTKDGRRFLDGSSGPLAVNIGHSHPRVLQAMRDQLETTTFAYRMHFVNETTEALAHELAAVMPGELERVFFVSGGSEAVEACIKVARQWAIAMGQEDRTKVISLAPSYHGATFGALAVTGHQQRLDPFAPMIQVMPKIPAPQAYLDNDELSAEDRGLHYARMLEDEIVAQGPETVLAFLMEPVGGASTGANVPPETYLPEIRRICDRHGLLLIADEVMSGLGRCGRYLATEHWGVVPDVAAVSKGLGAGYVPLGAMITSDRVLEPIAKEGGFVHGHTYAGNPLACAAGRAVLAEVVEHDLCGRAEAIGDRLLDGLEQLRDRHHNVGHVRGKGALLGLELVADPSSLDPLPVELDANTVLAELCYDRGLILYPGRTRGGYEGDHLLVGPPINSSDEEVDELIDKLDDALDEFDRWVRPAAAALDR